MTTTEQVGEVARIPRARASWSEMNDGELFEFAQRLDFTGPAWQILERHLVAYALGVLQGWAESGQIFRIAAQKRALRKPLTPEQMEWFRSDSHMRSDLINSAIAKSLVLFLHAARNGQGWRVDGGASLTTYFLTRCVFTFADEFAAQWRADQKWYANLDVDSDKLDRYAVTLTSTEVFNGSLDSLDSILSQLGQRDRVIAVAKAHGYTHREIAVILATTEKAIERRIARLRKTHSWIGDL